MTVSSSTNKVSYNGNGSTTVFAYTFKIFDQDDLTVIIRSANGTETTQTITTHYTVSGVGDAGGGNVTMLTAPASGETITILREQDLLQGLDLVPNDPFPAQSLEDALDKLVFMVQQHDEELARTIKASKTNTITSTEFTVSAADRANKIFAFDGSGELSVTQELGTFRGDWAASTAFAARDIVKDTSNNNIYIANTSHTSSGTTPISTNADSAKWDLLVDAAAAATSAAAAASSATAAASSATDAANSATAAAASESTVAASATAAATSETNAAASATAAAASATAAAASETAAATSETNAATSETNAATSASNAATSASNASTSETNAASSASTASTAATTATTQASNAATSASAAATSATNAATSATAAASSETNAASSATAASTSATNAGTSETNAASSATAAAASAATAAVSESNAATSETNAATSETNASTSASNAATSETNAATSATNAATSETNAASSATAAASSATSASTSATNAASSATNAASSASAAAASQTSAAASAAAAASAYDTFDDRYLGSKTSDPTLDNDGNALVAGALYFNSTANEMRVYDGANWIAATSAGNTSLLEYNYTATSGQTTFSGADDNSASMSYIQDNIIVTLNGVTLENGSDYSATDGLSVVLTTGATTGDELNVVAFKSFTTADMVSSSAGGVFYGNVDFSAGIDVTGNITVTGTVDGRDLATDGAKLDNINQGVATTDSPTFVTLNATTVDLGDWTVTESSGTLFFAYQGTNKMKVDSSGNLTCVGDVTAFGTV